MNIEQLMGRYLRLKQDLEIAYNAHPWHSGRINRLTDDIARTERELADRSSSNPVMQLTLSEERPTVQAGAASVHHKEH